MVNKQADVIVIGAGIAGASTAVQLAGEGHHTILLDRQEFPRHKTCGEFMSPETKEMLEFLSIHPAEEKIHPSYMDRARIIMPQGGEITAPLPGEAWGISRYELDRLLHERALSLGTEILTKTTVTSIERVEHGRYRVQIRTGNEAVEYDTKAVIAAYGTRKPKFAADTTDIYRDETVYIGVKSHYTGLLTQPEVELYFCEGGYTGINPIQDGMVNVAALLTLESIQGYGKSVEDILHAAAKSNPKLADRLKDAVPVEGTQVSIAPVRLSDLPEPWSDFPHVGDAMMMIPPLCGDGMSIALRSSMLCSRLTNLYLEDHISHDEWKSRYTNQANQEFTQLLRRARMIQKLAFSKTNHWYPELAKRFPGLASYLVKATRLPEKGIMSSQS
ncbi:FAD-dependent oxidoreductase [Paenibacillus lemnae]|uniref:FAD-dependent oxidoreductase n=1 Tax=Paenibacillus lemnae TaxID=1330551 RepID=A0A848M5V1_PAELE|nr:FAD-dependent oxidoreductase [Paenibacillus lemnae]NMO95629.1 FAD-dependent oxidoreductase [Paenibacillus lemnae]